MPVANWPVISDDTGDLISGTPFNAAYDTAVQAALNAVLDDAGYIPKFSGLVVGFSGSGATDQVQVGDANFLLDFGLGGASVPGLGFDANDTITYDRGSDAFSFTIASAVEAILNASGLQIADGLVVGFSGTPSADEVKVGDANFKLDFNGGGSSIPSVQFDTNDRIDFDRAESRLKFLIGSTEIARISAAFGVALYKGADVASAAAIVPTGNVFHVTGTTSITSITSTGILAGTVITIIFDGVLTFTDGGNLKLAGNLVTTADDTVTLVYDGTNWYEIARSVN